VLPAGADGRPGEITALFGYWYRAVGSWYATETDQFCQVLTNLLTPAEQLQFDLLVHEDLEWALDPRIAILGTLDGRPARLAAPRDGFSPPFTETIVDLGRGLAGTATPHMPGYGALLEWVFGRVGADPAAFRAFRFEMAYPPIPAQAILYSELPPADADGRHAFPAAQSANGE
jgi:hypothetical protein